MFLRHMLSRGVAGLFGSLSLAGPSGALEFAFPVACNVGIDCVVQNYVDHDPGPGRRDYACGRLSYDGHDGTDIRAMDLAAMRAGIPVLAAADGVVRAVRDGMPDRTVAEADRASVAGREAGNGVVIDHGSGWQTQYSHLKQGSVTVAPRDRVVAGQPLGLIGLSGLTEFPHVEFSIRRNGVATDPFSGRPAGSGCEGENVSLWRASAESVVTYRDTGLLVDGFADAAPDITASRSGESLGRVAEDPAALVYWVDLFGVQSGDRQEFRLVDPAGRVLVEERRELDASHVSWFAFAGRRRPTEGWRPGWYTATYRLMRGDETIVHRRAAIKVGS